MRNPFKKKDDPFAASRYANVFKSGRERERKHMRHWWQWAIVGLFLLIALVGGYAYYRYWHLRNQIHVDIADVVPEVSGHPFNALLIGSDSRTGLTPAEQLKLGANAVGGQRSDTVILAHVDPVTNHVTMVQFPRDLYVPIASGGTDKITNSYAGGRDNLVKTVANLTGLKINRYAEVNLAGFRDLVNAVGGVDVCITETIPFDPNTGLEVTKPGLIHFSGDEALRFVRSRHSFATGDFARIENQQKFIAAAIHKVTSVSAFFNPLRISHLVDAAGRNLKTPETPLGLYHLLQRFRNLNPDNYEAYTAPNLGTKTITLSNGLPYSIVVPNYPAMKVMFRAIANNESPAQADGVPDIDPSTIRVGVYNGDTLAETVAGPAADALKTATNTNQSGGLNVVDVANANHFGYKQTVVKFDPDKPETRQQAQFVAAAIPGAKITEGKTPSGIDVAVVVGKAPFKTKQLVQLLPIPLPQPGALPSVCQHPGELGHGP
ncbi:MAG: LCP family protein [Actinomycetota bacterium]|nr:LCP family protein [Actinomycetota bacterium]